MNFFRKKNTSRATVIAPRRNRVFRRHDRMRTNEDTSGRVGWPWLYGFLWAGFLLFLPALAFFSPLLHVGEIRVQFDSSPMLDKDQVEQFVRANISRPVSSMISGDTLPVVWFRRNSVHDALMSEFPLIREAEIIPVFPNSIVVQIVERHPTLVLCSAGPCFLVDDIGTAYQSESDQESDLPFLQIIDQSGKPIVLGEKVFSQEFLRYAIALCDTLRDTAGIAVEREIVTPSRLSNELRFRTLEGWELWVDTSVPIERLLSEMRLLFAKTLPESARTTLVYLDLRASGKAFYLDQSAEEAHSEDVSISDDSTEKKSEKEKKKK